MYRRHILMLAAAMLANASLAAQPVAPVAIPGIPADQQKMLAELQAAQAAARQPGDDKLSCEEIKAQTAAVLNDPAVKAHIAMAQPPAQGAKDPPGQTDQIGTIMPKLMRSQALAQLAVSKNCEWLTAAAPIAAPPTP